LRPVNDLIVSSVSNSASFSSGVVWANSILRASFQISVSSGSCAGTFVVQASNDQSYGLPANQFKPVNWNTIGSASTIVCSTTAVGSSSCFLIPYTETSYEYLKIVYTDLSGGTANGVVSVRMCSKGL
jgi:hypothetical protein